MKVAESIRKILEKTSGAVVGACYSWEFHGGGASHLKFGATELTDNKWKCFRDFSPVQESATNGDCRRADRFIGTVLVARKQGPGMYQPGDTTFRVLDQPATESEYDAFWDLVWTMANERATSLGFKGATPLMCQQCPTTTGAVT